MTRRPPVPLHVVEVGALLLMPGDADHRASGRCTCKPVLYRDLSDVWALVYVHRPPAGMGATEAVGD